MQSLASSLILLAGAASAASYMTGEIKTRETFKYGRFSTRMKASGENGTCGSFFLYYGGPDAKSGQWNEIDIEIVPSMANPFSMNIIYEWGEHDQSYDVGFQPNARWNDYVVEWTPDYVKWKVNGEVVRKTEDTYDVHFLTHEMNLFMNFWSPTYAGWGDDFSDANMPFYTTYDYVKVETYNTETGSFEWHWRDDFDSLDEDRWVRSNGWGYSSSSSSFSKNQVYTHDGNLVIKMQKPNAELEENDELEGEHEVKEIAEIVQ